MGPQAEPPGSGTVDIAAYNFDPMDPELLRDPYPAFRYLRENDPVHWSGLGFRVVTRFDDARRVLIDKHFGQGDFVRNIQLFYDADFDVLAHPAYAWLSRVFVMQDPPDHTRLRGLISNALSLKRIRAMEPRIRELAVQQLAHFEHPDRFDVSPREQKPLTFGGGIHYCIGAELARLEGRVFLEELFQRYPDFRVDVAGARQRPAFLFRGLEHLPVRLC